MNFPARAASKKALLSAVTTGGVSLRGIGLTPVP
jgi:hypothetical protein